jgi:hypothetical protein
VEAFFKENPEKAKQITGEVFFPAMALVDCTNDQLSKHIWGILS